MTRSRVVALVVLVALLGTVAAALLSPRAEPSPAQNAAASCQDAERFQALVADNAPINDVLDVLGDAERKAESAADRDPRWLALAGGLQSIRIALNADDAAAATVGISVVRTECRRF